MAVDEQDPNLLPLVTGNGRTLATADITALIGLINGMLASMEGRIMDRLSKNATSDEARWEKHDLVSERTIGAIREEIGVLRADFKAHLTVANAHFAKEHDDQLVLDARVRPVKTTVQWLVGNWPKVLALLFGILGFLALLGDWAERYLGGIGT